MDLFHVCVELSIHKTDSIYVKNMCAYIRNVNIYVCVYIFI